MIRVDDRTPEQKVTHRWGVVAKDKFMSEWGGAEGGASRCAWACHPEGNIDKLERWVRSRSEMRYVNVVDLNAYHPPPGTVHYHIYVANLDHPGFE